MQETISEADILDFLDKLKLFVPNLGEYEYHSSENFQYLVKTSNHSIKVPMEQLVANRQKQLTQEHFKAISEELVSKVPRTEDLSQVKGSQVVVKRKSVAKNIILTFSILIIIGLAAFLIALNQEPSLRKKVFDDSSGSSTYYDEEVNSSVYEKPKTEAELKEDLLQLESQQPTKFLTGKLRMTPVYKNLLSMKVVGIRLKGSLQNSATLATFKNTKIKVRFNSYTGSELFSKVYEVYDYIGPQSSTNYTYEIEVTNQEYEDIENFSWEVLDAEV